MRGALGALFIVAIIGLGVYFTFIREMKPNPGESLAMTRGCIDERSDLSVDDDLTAQMNRDLGFGEGLAIGWHDERALLFVFNSEGDARRAQTQLLGIASDQGVQASEVQLRREDFEVLLYAAGSSSAAGRQQLASCVWAVLTPQFADFNLLDSKTLGRPFDPTFPKG
jgi:hypothetical protein